MPLPPTPTSVLAGLALNTLPDTALIFQAFDGNDTFADAANEFLEHIGYGPRVRITANQGIALPLPLLPRLPCPEIRYSSEKGPFFGFPSTTIATFREEARQKIRTILGVIVYGGSPIYLERMYAAERLINVAAGTGYYAPRADHPLEPGRTIPGSPVPLTLVVGNLPEALVHFLVRKKYVASTQGVALFFDTSFHCPTLVCGLIFYDRAPAEEVGLHVKDVLKKNGINNIFYDYIAHEERVAGYSPFDNPTDIYDDIKVERAPERRDTRNGNIVYYLLLPPLTTRFDRWRRIKNLLRAFDYSHPQYGPGTIADGIRCTGCGGEDHEQSWCKWPAVVNQDAE